MFPPTVGKVGMRESFACNQHWKVPLECNGSGWTLDLLGQADKTECHSLAPRSHLTKLKTQDIKFLMLLMFKRNSSLALLYN